MASAFQKRFEEAIDQHMLDTGDFTTEERGLLELLLEVTRENERLKKRMKIYDEVVHDKEIAIKESGSIAEAAIKISGVLEAAQDAADMYLENIKRLERELKEQKDGQKE